MERNVWTSVFFKESTDWGELLYTCETCYEQFWISPLHSADGKHNAPHWHVVVRNAAPWKMLSRRSKHNALVRVEGCNGYSEPVKSFQGILAYLIHLNDPEKQQFEGGFSEVTTNAPEFLFDIVPIDRGFSGMDWHQAHYPRNFREVLDILAHEPVISQVEAAHVVNWYVNHADVYKLQPDVFERVETQNALLVEELALLYEDSPHV